MTAGPPGLARELIRLLIVVIRLIIAILTFLGGAANYRGLCSGHISIDLTCPRGIRSLCLQAKLVTTGTRFKRLCGADGASRRTIITCDLVVMSAR